VTISDQAFDRLRRSLSRPDLAGTRYRILRHAASGGMGAVYEADDTLLKRRVALKVLHPAEAYLDQSAVDRLLEEAGILARLEHPGIVPVHDAGVLPDGNVFYTMKFVEGQRLDRYARSGKRVADLLRVFQKICETVAFAHARNIVHRDLKPENIMVGAFGEVLVLDWGIAKVLDGRHEPPGIIVGTPDFMAPEQARGENDRVDLRSDVFALGGVLRFILTGTQPSPSLIAVCSRAQAENPAERYSSAIELSQEVDRHLNGMPVHAYRESVVEQAARVVRNNRMAFSLIAAYLLMRILFLFFVHR
jgi:serine/threonine protein kinase